MPLRVFIVDSNRLALEGLRKILEDQDVAICGEATTLRALREVEAASLPDVTLMNFAEDDSQRLEEARMVRQNLPQMRLVALSETFSRTGLMQCLEAGIDGYLVKNISSSALKLSLQLVAKGEKVLPSELANVLLSGPPMRQAEALIDAGIGLSPREIQILGCLISGLSNKDIARELQMAESTAKVHLKTILRKLRARNRTEAAVWALCHSVTPAAKPSRPARGRQAPAKGRANGSPERTLLEPGRQDAP
jgi:two-component system nitrate/nitrite response regulator NarL